MGAVRLFGSHGGRSAPNTDPDPNRFKVLRVWQGDHAHAIELNYPNCTNFEGNKILVMPGNYDPTLRVMDPHFAASPTAPLARFTPSTWGWSEAMRLAGSYKPTKTHAG